MRKLLLSAVMLATSVVQAHAAVVNFSANLTGDQEVPRVVTGASGNATLELNDSQTELFIDLFVRGIFLSDLVGAPGIHIHQGPAGTNGPVVFGFGPTGFNNNIDGDESFVESATGFSLSAVWDVGEGTVDLASAVPDLLAGNLYINVHTNDHLSGEIRGQISAVPLPASFLLLSGGLAALGFAARKKKKQV
ncbi:CHRD domain-containing protein [Roseovarius aestuariivivens]|uniref:CHRD domain-containing protein n=1 Tax=Roseovarius aestuariivivens TaxID=1888910 RepID=UPI0010805689|nr:CHRD domain-containing protein [Roseovarius aestuariivivens]